MPSPPIPHPIPPHLIPILQVRDESNDAVEGLPYDVIREVAALRSLHHPYVVWLHHSSHPIRHSLSHSISSHPPPPYRYIVELRGCFAIPRTAGHHDDALFAPKPKFKREKRRRMRHRRSSSRSGSGSDGASEVSESVTDSEDSEEEQEPPPTEYRLSHQLVYALPCLDLT
jgi:hypothetical protein